MMSTYQSRDSEQRTYYDEINQHGDSREHEQPPVCSGNRKRLLRKSPPAGHTSFVCHYLDPPPQSCHPCPMTALGNLPHEREYTKDLASASRSKLGGAWRK